MDITPAFNDAANPADEAGAVAESPAPRSPDDSSAVTAAPGEQIVLESQSTPMTTEAAQAEIDSLEQGRAEPAPRNNLNPETRLKKIVDSEFERQREARIRALEAYVEFAQGAAANDLRHDADQGLELHY